MFKHIDMPTGNGLLRQAWNKLIRVIQTEVEHKRITNAEAATALARGDIVYASGDSRESSLALNDTAEHADWVAVVTEPIPIGGEGIARTEGYALVRLVPTDAPAAQEGLPVYVSDVAGAGTITIPVAGVLQIVGILADATDFDAVTNPFVWVQLGHCCEPVDTR